MRLATIVCSVALAACAACVAGAQTRRALLVGINLYQPPETEAKHPAGCSGGRCDLPVFENLDGALNDVASMRDLLTSPKFGFAPSDVTVLTNPLLPASQLSYTTLPASQTSRDGILTAMQKYLVDLPQRGDMVVFYYAGHGSLRLNSQGTKLSLLVDGKEVHADSTLVPSDAWTGSYDVRDREMTRIFNAALDKGIKLTVILDSCHSGAFTRGVPLGPKAKERMLPYDPRDINERPEAGANGDPIQAPAERTDNPALIFSAAQQDQTAKEAPNTDSVPEAHGAFTAALIKALQVLPVDAPASAVAQRVSAELEGNGIADQSPSLDAIAVRRQQPLLGGTAGVNGQLRTAVVAVSDDRTITLDAGKLAGVGPGSTFVSFGVEDPAKRIHLKVTELQGIARSTASITAPAGAAVHPGDVFELETWVPAASDPLHFWFGPSNLPQAEIVAVSELLRASGFGFTSDPAEQAWTHLLYWDGSKWILQKAGDARGISLGAKLDHSSLKLIPQDAKIWVNLPIPAEIAGKLNLSNPDRLAQSAPDIGSADYVLAGTVTEAGPAWTWYHKAEFLKGPPDLHAPAHSPGCSHSSNYPIRTDWVTFAAGASGNDGAEKLNDYAERLAKLAGWLRLPSSPAGGEDDYYHLSLVHATDSTPIAADHPVSQGDRLKLMLSSETRVLEKRWVYVLDIDCHGNGSLIYPTNFSENRFPNDANDQKQIVLPGGPVLKVGAPYGMDTLLLISTDEPLGDPYSLNFKGVATRSGTSARSPLEKLLANASSGTRGFDLQEVPTNWSVTVTELQSVPTEAQ